MCASYCSLLLILLTSSIWSVTEGLPISKQERGADEDILAGADFLSVLMESSAVQKKPVETKSTTLRTSSTSVARLNTKTPQKLYVRELHSPRTIHSTEPSPLKFSSNAHSKRFPVTHNVTYGPELNITKENKAINQINSSLVVSVHVSSSVGDSHINKISQDLKFTQEPKNSSEIEVTNKSTKGEENVVASEEYTSLISDSNKSEFSVDELDPITSGTENEEQTEEYPVNVQTISNKYNEKIEPFGHHSLVYHDQPAELMQARSVSYSTVIQSVPKTHAPQTNVKELTDKWMEPIQNERQHRNFDLKNGPNENDFLGLSKNYKEDFQIGNKKKSQEESSSAAETNDHFVTARYESAQNYHKHFSNEKQLSWKNSDLPLISETTPRKTTLSTEKYWEGIDKSRDQSQMYTRSVNEQKRRFPITYGKPEQNYEIDESVSVMSNGRVHGVQGNKIQLPPQSLDGKIDPNTDNQKVGYVVEGRNYRKYRVEERTSDGFIVGEYGVVSHDDGSLRGVRYTADGTTNPRLIYDALMKFLSL